MSADTQRFATVVLLALLGGGIIAFMVFAMTRDGAVSGDDAGWLAAAFLSLREVMSKMENVAMGVRTPAPPVKPAGESNV